MSVKYEVIKHNDSLYAVMSIVTGPGMFGLPQTFKNFVAEAKSEAEAQAIINKLEGN